MPCRYRRPILGADPRARGTGTLSAERTERPLLLAPRLVRLRFGVLTIWNNRHGAANALTRRGFPSRLLLCFELLSTPGSARLEGKPDSRWFRSRQERLLQGLEDFRRLQKPLGAFGAERALVPLEAYASEFTWQRGEWAAAAINKTLPRDSHMSASALPLSPRPASSVAPGPVREYSF